MDRPPRCTFASTIPFGKKRFLDSVRSRLLVPALLLFALATFLPGAAAHAQQLATPPPTASADTATQAGPPADFAPPPEGRPLRGVTWHPPADRAQAVRELRRIKKAGVEAVRTPLIRREALLRAADSLRLRLFQDLPAAYLSAGELEETLPRLRWELERALLVARGHPSARHFGLLSHGDTSEPGTCAVLRELAARVRATGPEETIAYYGTPFVEADRCAGATSLTLLDALNRERPQALLRRWRQARASGPADTTTPASPEDSRSPRADSGAVGVGALGTWVDPSAEGLRAPHSPQSQARYFEKHLPLLFRDAVQTPAPGAARSPAAARPADSLGPAPAVVFAYRWRDAQGGDAGSDSARTDGAGDSGAGDSGAVLQDPYGRVYGLLTAGGQPRPALKVVRGLYTERQTVFAFDAGTAPPERPPWLVLMGWGLVAVLGGAYAGASRFRGLVRRYFGSASFYRDAVREKRAALGTGSLTLLAGVSFCAGLVVTVFLLAVQETSPFLQMLRGASGWAQGWMRFLLARPWMAVLIVAAFYTGSLAMWAFLLSLASRRAQPLSPTQTLALVTWPRWPAFLLGTGAVVAGTLPPGWMLPVSGALGAAWVLVSVAAALRTLYDVARMSGLSPFAAPVLALLNPVLLAAVMAFFAILEVLPEARFLWHLATRS